MSTVNEAYQSPADDIGTRADARQQLLWPAIGLVVTSTLHCFGWLYFVVFVYNIVSHPEADSAGAHSLKVYCLYYGISVLYSLVLISGAFSMLRRGSYLWATATCVLALVPIMGACYVFSIPFGIWGLLVLRRPEVRAAFRSM